METRGRVEWACLALAAVLSIPAWAAPTGTVFTYQGRLLDEAVAADDYYDMQFALFDAPSGGTQVSSTLEFDDLVIREGYFTVPLDFGGAVFSGQARWLEIAIRPGSSTNPADYVTLEPRQEITVAPYAMFALSSGVTRYGSGSVEVELEPEFSGSVATIPFNFPFSAGPVVIVTGKNNTGTRAALVPSVANVTAAGFDLVLANPSRLFINGSYNFDWLAAGNGNVLSFTYKDIDGDGYSDGITSTQSPPPTGYYPPAELTAAEGDCDDEDPDVYPGAAEIWYDGVDQDCDGRNDYDQDLDGYVHADYPGQAGGTAPYTGDCDDTNTETYPGGTEWCDQEDNDCDSVVDEDCLPPRSCTLQQTVQFNTCMYNCLSGGSSPELCLGPCVNPIPEPCRGALLNLVSCGVANGCVPSGENPDPPFQRCLLDHCPEAYYDVYGPAVDGDGDGYYVFEDCDDANPLIHPGANEIIDGIDNNCDGIIDISPLATDNDSDGWCEGWDHDANSGTPVMCTDASTPGDCMDQNNQVYPGAAELCDGLDNDCDSIIDPENSAGCNPFYYDGDGDGWYATGAPSQCLCEPSWPYTGQEEGDCDDGNPEIWPGIEELCDGLDNNCDGQTDEDIFGAWCGGEGLCSAANEMCIDGQWYKCGSQIYELLIPDYEEVEVTCDNLDNDCDGMVDEDTGGDLCPMQEGVCGGSVFMCMDGQLFCEYSSEYYEPEETTCDGLDNDCDGQIDEMAGGLCGMQDGVCAGTTFTCEGGQIVCQYPPEYEFDEVTCDGLDNDCDGAVDEIFPELGQPCTSGVGECYAEGVRVCSYDGAFTECNAQGDPASMELCDGLDNDCDGTVDQPFTDLGQPCWAGDGECYAEGEMECTPDGAGTECSAQPGPAYPEVCDGLDNDCDGTVDEEWDSQLCPQQDGVCSGMMEMCSNGELVCPYSNHPYYETGETLCDGLDNDCDGMTDEDLIGVLCPLQNGVCSGSRQICDGPNGFEICEYMTYLDHNPSYQETETSCDGLDNDCDGQIDDNLTGTLCPLQYGVCSGSRQVCDGVNGWQTCDPTLYTNWNVNYQSAEAICDGLDNDCDGMTDEPFPDLGQACTEGDGECQAAGYRVCSIEGTGTVCDAVPGLPYPETCDGLDNDCDGIEDEDLNPGDLCPQQAGVCSGSAETCYEGQMTCQYELIANYESIEMTCDGLDNDCDGAADENITGDLCPIQTGVCAGSVQLCGGAGGFDSCDGDAYLAHSPDYQVTETTCDGRDNDCDGVIDEGCGG